MSAQTYRKVSGLVHATLSETGPNHAPEAKATGAKLAGLRYERKVKKTLPQAKCGQWFYFIDANGPGYCQPDMLLRAYGERWLIEVKLSDVEGAEDQLRRLYLPVVRLASGHPDWRVCKIVKSVKPWSKHVVYSLGDAARLHPGLTPTLLWPGRGPLK